MIKLNGKIAATFITCMITGSLALQAQVVPDTSKSKEPMDTTKQAVPDTTKPAPEANNGNTSPQQSKTAFMQHYNDVKQQTANYPLQAIHNRELLSSKKYTAKQEANKEA